MYPTSRVKQVVGLVARQVKERLGPNSRIIWFGSWITGSARRTSDIDLAIEMDGGVPKSEYAQLAAWIDEDLPTLYRVDLVNLDEVGETLRQEILSKGIAV